jgi:glycylpeptide N-tetradecanoyltransferase
MASDQEQAESEAFAEGKGQDVSTSGESQDSGDEDMIQYWNSQPVPEHIKENTEIEEGPVKVQRIEDIPTEPTELPSGVEWCNVDSTNGEEMNGLWVLLNGQYVEDDDGTFRLSYSKSLLRWYVCERPSPHSRKCAGN